MPKSTGATAADSVRKVDAATHSERLMTSSLSVSNGPGSSVSVNQASTSDEVTCSGALSNRDATLLASCADCRIASSNAAPFQENRRQTASPGSSSSVNGYRSEEHTSELQSLRHLV